MKNTTSWTLRRRARGEEAQRPSPFVRRSANVAPLSGAVVLALLVAGFGSAGATANGYTGVPATSAPYALSDAAVEPSGIEADLIGSEVPSFATGDAPPGEGDLTVAPPYLAGTGLPRPAAPGETPVEEVPWFVAPVPGGWGSPFGPRLHPILGIVRMHNGVDMHAACGEVVVAAAKGQVTFAGWNGGYGYLVVIDHGIIEGRRLQTKYGHLSVIGVKAGQQVAPGNPIGLAGTTGLSTGCHLHFEVKVNGVYVDPAPFLTGTPSIRTSLLVANLTPPAPVSATQTSLTPVSLVSSMTTPSASALPSVTPSETPSVAPSETPSATPSGTPSVTPTETTSPTVETPSATPGQTETPATTPAASTPAGTTPAGTPSATVSSTPVEEASPPPPAETVPAPAPDPAPAPKPEPEPEPVVTVTKSATPTASVAETVAEIAAETAEE